jgi:hypothetical protein
VGSSFSALFRSNCTALLRYCGTNSASAVGTRYDSVRLWLPARHGGHFSSPPPPLLHRPWVLVTMKPPRGNRSPYGTPPWKPHGVSSFNWLSDGGSPRITRPAYEPGGPQPSSNSQYPASGSRWPESESRTSPTLFQCSVQVRFRKGRVSPEPDFLAATVRSLTAKAAPTRGKDMQVIVTNMQATATQGSRAGRSGLLPKH